jgi:hypothetical protein
VPKDEVELFQFIQKLADQFKRTGQLKEALSTTLWQEFITYFGIVFDP